MNKNLYLILTVIILSLSFCSKAQPSGSNKKILIVYLSRTNNTKVIAEMIHRQTGGKMVAIELEKPYPSDYRQTVEQVVKENETGFLPPLKTRIDSIQNYDIVFIGFPTWGMKLPPPMKSFLNQYQLKGKTIVPFNTNDGYGTGSSFATVNELCKGNTVLEGFTIKGGRDENGQANLEKAENANAAEIKVKEWLKKIKLLQ